MPLVSPLILIITYFDIFLKVRDCFFYSLFSIIFLGRKFMVKIDKDKLNPDYSVFLFKKTDIWEQT